MENQIDDFFRDRLADAEVCPDPGLWNQIEKAMVRKKERRIRIYSTAAMLVFAACSFVLLLIFPSETKPGRVIISNPVQGSANEALTKNEVIQQAQAESQIPARSFASIVNRQPDRKGMDLNYAQAPENVSLPVQDVMEKINETVAEEVVFQDLADASNSESDVIVFELLQAEEIMPQMVRQPKIFRSVMGLKRDGISLSAIQDFKSEIFNRLNRNRQRIEETETKFQTTEQ